MLLRQITSKHESATVSNSAFMIVHIVITWLAFFTFLFKIATVYEEVDAVMAEVVENPILEAAILIAAAEEPDVPVVQSTPPSVEDIEASGGAEPGKHPLLYYHTLIDSQGVWR